MSWKWLITSLGVPVGIGFGTFLPKVDGIFIGKERKKVKAEEIEDSAKELRSGVLDYNVTSKMNQGSEEESDIELSIPCMEIDFEQNWMEDIKKLVSDSSFLKEKILKDIEEIMKEVANTIYGCKSWFSTIKEKSQQEEIIKKRIKRFQKDSGGTKRGERKFKFGLGTSYEKSKSSSEKVGKFFNGIEIEFKKFEKANSVESKRLSDSLYWILLKSIKEILREGKWSKTIWLNSPVEQQYKKANRYPSEQETENLWVRSLMEKCASKCLFNSDVGVNWNPSSKSKGVAKWFWGKVTSNEENSKKMVIKNVLMSMYFNWKGIKSILEQVIWNNIYGWNENEKQAVQKPNCWVGNWGLICPKGGIVWEDLKAKNQNSFS